MEITGKLFNDNVHEYSGYTVVAEFDRVETSDDTDGQVIVAASRRVSASLDGRFTLNVPDSDKRSGPILLSALYPDGIIGGRLTVAENSNGNNLVLNISQRAPIIVENTDQPTLGQNTNYSGRVIDISGNPAQAGLVVVIWAAQGDEEAAPVSVAKTTVGGYFSGPWPSKIFSSAAIIVAREEPVAIVLEDGKLPFRLIAVLEKLPDIVKQDEDCDCVTVSPRVQSAEELAENSAAFSSDIGKCVDFTVPNRAVDEVVYQAVVRTTQPELNPPEPPAPPEIPTFLIDKLAALANVRPQNIKLNVGITGKERVAPETGAGSNASLTLGEKAAPAATNVLSSSGRMGDLPDLVKPAIANAEVLTPGIDLDAVFTAGTQRADSVADVVLANRASTGNRIVLDPGILDSLVRDNRTLSPERLLEAEQSSIVTRFRDKLRLISRKGAGRFYLSDHRQIDWDNIPDRFQATTIAHGHLLTMKQVWRSDGYSLGDLLYSLPLAPGQQKLISVLDWDRREVAARRASRTEQEDLSADLSRDRDISDIVRATLSESMTAESHADVAAVGGGIGGFIGPVVFGAAGGVSTAGSTASQTSARSSAGIALNRVRDRTLQSASAIRSQRATVVQTAREGESVRAQTEVIANYNHCHALTMEYFEVLRHLQVTHTLSHVQECLFIPFTISAFDEQKALRWEDQLVTGLRRRSLQSAFASLERVATNWIDADVPAARYADEIVRHIDGELRMRISLPKPADDENNEFLANNWSAYEDENLLGQNSASDVWERYFGGIRVRDRQRVWDTRIAPAIAQRLVSKLALRIHFSGGGFSQVSIDPTLVSRYKANHPLLVSLHINGSIPTFQRAAVRQVEILFIGVATLPPGAEVRIDSASMNYRTDHYRGYLFRNRRVLNDLSLRETGDDTVFIATPLTAREKRNPRKRDQRRSEKLLDYLNEHIEYYHRIIWSLMDVNRRYMLLDGFIAPNAGGKSVASVVENRVIGIVGNSLVMPVAPGQKLDPTYEFAKNSQEDLIDHYAIDDTPAMRISLPTPGVFSEAVMGKCNSCEEQDDTRFWRFEEEPIPDSPAPIGALSTDSRRRQPPNVSPDAFPDSVIRFQEAPKAVDPTGLAAAMQAIGTSNIFKDLTGLAQNQANASQAFKSTMKIAQEFASRGAAIAQQSHLNRELDNNLDAIKKARDSNLTDEDSAQALTEDLFRRAIGERTSGAKSPSDNPKVKQIIERAASSEKGSITIYKPTGSVAIETSNEIGSDALNIHIDPPLSPVKQKSSMVCWAAGGAMMRFWQVRTTSTVEDVLDSFGGSWRAKYDANEGLSPSQFRAFMSNLNVVEEGPQSFTPKGIARLLALGPLLTIGDDGVEKNSVVHVRIVTGITGDGSADGTDVVVADSATGLIEPMSFVKFARNLESREPVSTGLGVFHF